MKLIGLCGRSGSGKGYVSECFLHYEIPSIDTDALYREMTCAGEHPSGCVREIADAFGGDMINADNSLNRRKLGEAVFSDPEKLALLNRITHKHILDKVRADAARLEKAGCRALIVDAPLLFESGFDRECDFTVAVVAPEEKRIERIIRRDGITRDAAEARLRVQMSDRELEERCDFTVHNGGDDEKMRCDIEAVVKALFGKE